MPKHNPKKKIKALLFDLGKVIVDFDFSPAFKRMAKSCPLETVKIKEFFMNSGLEVLYDGGKITSVQFHHAVKQGLQHNLDFEEFKNLWNEIFTLNKDIARLIAKARRNGYRLVLISNTNEMHFAYVRRRYSVLNHFNRFILSYKERVRKPDARIYEKAARACRALPEEILYIDDREDLTEAAETLGFHTFTFRKNTPELLKKMSRLGIIC